MRPLQFPSQKTILQALHRWREERRLHKIGEAHYRQYVEACRERDITPKRLKTYYSWLAVTHPSPLEYDQLVALIQSLKDPDGPKVDICVDVDLFLDYCLTPTLNDITIGTKKVIEIAGTKTIRSESESLGRNRTRLDYFKWSAGSESPWGQHDGHEYLYVVKGHLEGQFAATDVPEPQRQVIQLEQGSGIAFPSRLFHRIIAKADSEIAVARPTWTDAAKKTTG